MRRVTIQPFSQNPLMPPVSPTSIWNLLLSTLSGKHNKAWVHASPFSKEFLVSRHFDAQELVCCNMNTCSRVLTKKLSGSELS